MICRFTKFGTDRMKIYLAEDINSTHRFEYSAKQNTMIETYDIYRDYCTRYHSPHGQDFGCHDVLTFAQLFGHHNEAPIVVLKTGDVL